MPDDVAYAPVWQTWSLVREEPRDRAPARDARGTCATGGSLRAGQDLRERMQISRIQSRTTISELSQQVGCDVESLAAFERGEGVLGEDVQRRIRTHLRL